MNILIKEIQSKIFIYYMIPTVWHPGKGKTMTIVKGSVITGLRGQRWIGRVEVF